MKREYIETEPNLTSDPCESKRSKVRSRSPREKRKRRTNSGAGKKVCGGQAKKKVKIAGERISRRGREGKTWTQREREREGERERI